MGIKAAHAKGDDVDAPLRGSTSIKSSKDDVGYSLASNWVSSANLNELRYERRCQPVLS